MPKVSAEHVEARKAQILDGARRAFAAHGYDGATVAKLEEETGLSRGAIFNYYDDKLAIFQALAAEDSRRWLAGFEEMGIGGIDGIVRRLAREDPAWARVYVDVVRRMAIDPDFQRRMEEAEPEPEARAAGQHVGELQRTGVLRDDVDRKQIAAFLNLLAFGLMMFHVAGEEMDTDALLTFVHEGIDARK